MRKIVAIFIIVCALLFPLTSISQAAYCPAYGECINQDLFEDLDNLNYLDTGLRRVRSWEKAAIRVITRNGNSKTPTDMIWVSGEELAIGWAHFTAQNDRMKVNLEWDENIPVCGVPTPEIEEALLIYIYSEASISIQLRAWRQLLSYSITEARRNGLRARELTAIAVIANSGAYLPIRYGEICAWEICCITGEYINERPTRHRINRINALNLECD